MVARKLLLDWAPAALRPRFRKSRPPSLKKNVRYADTKISGFSDLGPIRGVPAESARARAHARVSAGRGKSILQHTGTIFGKSRKQVLAGAWVPRVVPREISGIRFLISWLARALFFG